MSYRVYEDFILFRNCLVI